MFKFVHKEWHIVKDLHLVLATPHKRLKISSIEEDK